VVIWICLVHLLALGAPFYFSWHGLVTCAAFIFLTGTLGVCMGYHRCLTHGSFQTYRPVRWLLAFLGGLSGEGSALTWVANHRKHHVFSDKEGDPHSPRDGKWWSHMLWFMPNFGRVGTRNSSRSTPDIMKDKMMVVIHFSCRRTWLGVGLPFCGYFATPIGSRLAGRLVDVVLGPRRADGVCAHVTWMINSVRTWGSQAVRYQ
jgi:stearoyl-CoA desaturase (delta-9 desaturase)